MSIFNTNTALNGSPLANSLARAYLLGASNAGGTTSKELVAGQDKSITFTGSASVTSDADGVCITSAGGGTSFAEIAADGFTPAGTSFTAVVTFKPSTVNPEDWAAICSYRIDSAKYAFLFERDSNLNDLLVGVGQFHDSPIYNGVASLTADMLTTCVITWNGSDFKLFLPNTAPFTSAYGASPQDTGAPISVHIGDWAGNYYFFAYSDTAWSDAQAQAVADDVAGQLLSTAAHSAESTGNFTDTTALANNTLGQSLKRAYVLGASEAVGTLKELVSGQNLAVTLHGGTSILADASHGNYVSLPTNLDYAAVVDNFTPAGAAFSTVVVYRLKTSYSDLPASAVWPGLIALQQTEASNRAVWEFWLGDNGGSSADNLVATNSANQDTSFANGESTLGDVGVVRCAVFTWAGAGQPVKMFCTGESAPLTSGPETGFPAGAADRLMLGSSGNTWPVDLFFFGWADTAWSDTEAQAIADDIGGQLLTTGAGGGITKLYLRTSAANAIPGFQDLVATAGASNHTSTTPTANAATELQVTEQVLEWISGRAPAGGFTLSGPVTFNLWSAESDAAANTALRARLFKRSSSGTETEIGGPYDMTAELAVGANAVNSWTGTPPDTVFAEDDRLVLRVYVTNAGGTMAGGAHVTLDYNGATSGADFDSWIALTPSVTFKPEGGNPPPPNGPYDLPSSAVPSATAMQGQNYVCMADYTFGTDSNCTIKTYNTLTQYFADKMCDGAGKFTIATQHDQWQWGVHDQEDDGVNPGPHNGDGITRILNPDNLELIATTDSRVGGDQAVYQDWLNQCNANGHWPAKWSTNGWNAPAIDSGVRSQHACARRLQKGGYFEWCMKMSPKLASWFALWMIDGSALPWPPEVDVNEMFRRDHDIYDVITNIGGPRFIGAPWADPPDPRQKQAVTDHQTGRITSSWGVSWTQVGVDLSADYHTYGLEWVTNTGNPDGDYFKFYFDNTMIWDGHFAWQWFSDNPATWHDSGPAVFQMQTAWGSDMWGPIDGLTDPAKGLPSSWNIKWFRMFEKAPA